MRYFVRGGSHGVGVRHQEVNVRALRNGWQPLHLHPTHIIPNLAKWQPLWEQCSIRVGKWSYYLISWVCRLRQVGLYHLATGRLHISMEQYVTLRKCAQFEKAKVITQIQKKRIVTLTSYNLCVFIFYFEILNNNVHISQLLTAWGNSQANPMIEIAFTNEVGPQ